MKNKMIYDLKTGNSYEFMAEYSIDEVMVKDKKGNKIILNIEETITDEEVNNFKTIFKLLCKNKSIKLISEKYSEHGKTRWNDDIGSTPVYKYLETSIELDGKKILTNTCSLND